MPHAMPKFAGLSDVTLHATMRVSRRDEPRNNYMQTPASSPAKSGLLSSSDDMLSPLPPPAASPLRQQMASAHTSPLARLTTPPIYPGAPPRTPLNLVGLERDVLFLPRSPPKRLPALAGSASAPTLGRGQVRAAEPPQSAGVADNPYVQSAAENTRALAKRTRSLEARIEEMSKQLTKEKQGRRAREDRLAAQAEVSRRLQQQAYEEEIGELKEALSQLEAKYQRGVQQYERKLHGVSEEMQTALERQQEASREMAKMGGSQRERHIEHLTQMAARRMGEQVQPSPSLSPSLAPSHLQPSPSPSACTHHPFSPINSHLSLSVPDPQRTKPYL